VGTYFSHQSILGYFMGIWGKYVWNLTKTLKPKSKIATSLFPFTDTLMITFKQKNRFQQVILTGAYFWYTRILTMSGVCTLYSTRVHVYVHTWCEYVYMCVVCIMCVYVVNIRVYAYDIISCIYAWLGYVCVVRLACTECRWTWTVGVCVSVRVVMWCE